MTGERNGAATGLSGSPAALSATQSDEKASCACRCHVNRGAGCDEASDTGSSGVAGVWSCVPCDGVTECDRCGTTTDQHTYVPATDTTPGDCVMPHPDQPHREAKFGLLCGRHFHGINDTLDEIATLYAYRAITLLPGPGGNERHGTRFGSPAPGRVDIMALSDLRNGSDWIDDPDAVPSVIGSLYGWVRLMSEEREDRRLLHVEGTLAAVIGVLKREKHWLAAFSGVDDYIADLRALHRHVATAVGETMWPRPIGSCPNCQAKLYVTPGVEAVTCGKCGSEWGDRVALARLQLIHEQDAAKRKAAG